jgi:hypothetical protein
LPPEAAESHTHLAHAVIRYLGLTAPEELVPFGINSAAGIVDLISRVRPPPFSGVLELPSFETVSNRFIYLVCDEFYHAHVAVVGAAGGMRLSVSWAAQSLVRSECRRRVSAIRERSHKSRTGGTGRRDT